MEESWAEVVESSDQAVGLRTTIDSDIRQGLRIENIMLDEKYYIEGDGQDGYSTVSSSFFFF